MKTYISGKITGLPLSEAKEKFSNHAELLKLKGYEPVNPFDLFTSEITLEWADYMALDMHALMHCEAIYMQKDWGQSKGARIEYLIAKELGLKVLFEGAFNE